MSSITSTPTRVVDHHEPWHAERVAARRRRRRHLAHAGIIALGWVLLVAFWMRAITIADAAVVVTIVTVVAGGLAATLILTLGWIVHNVRIHRVKGPRRSVPAVEERFTHDFVGRVLDADWDVVRAAGLVHIGVGDGHKHYRLHDDAQQHGEPPRWNVTAQVER